MTKLDGKYTTNFSDYTVGDGHGEFKLGPDNERGFECASSYRVAKQWRVPLISRLRISRPAAAAITARHQSGGSVAC